MDNASKLCYNAGEFYDWKDRPMRFPFLPTRIYGALTDIDPRQLHASGIRLLMLDFDNTIVPYTTSTPTPAMAAWLRDAAVSGLAICVVSNSKRPRVVEFCEKYGLDCITHAKKPFHRGIRACLDRYGMTPDRCALTGDQIYTDVLGANTAGVQSFLVSAIDNHNFWLRARHWLEIPWIFLARGRRVRGKS